MVFDIEIPNIPNWNFYDQHKDFSNRFKMILEFLLWARWEKPFLSR